MGVSSLRQLGEAELQEMEEKLDDVTYRRCKHVVTENRRVLVAVESL